MNNRRIIIYTGALAGISGCLLDSASFFVFAARYPGHDQLKDALSKLGATASPISGIVSMWWIIFGILMIIFALGFKTAYSDGDRFSRLAALCIALYGLGEGIGSGVFKFDIVNNVKTVSYLFHELFGTIGVFSILALPFLVLRTIPFYGNRKFKKFTGYIIGFGFTFFILFSIRYLNLSSLPTDLINRFTGLWQRLFLINYYIFLVAVGLRMIKEGRYAVQ